MLEVDRQPGIFTACNACTACPVVEPIVLEWNFYPVESAYSNGVKAIYWGFTQL